MRERLLIHTIISESGDLPVLQMKNSERYCICIYSIHALKTVVKLVYLRVTVALTQHAKYNVLIKAVLVLRTVSMCHMKVQLHAINTTCWRGQCHARPNPFLLNKICLNQHHMLSLVSLMIKYS